MLVKQKIVLAALKARISLTGCSSIVLFFAHDFKLSAVLFVISVIIPAYERSEMLFEAVDSVIRQTHKDFELIVVDDGSESDLEELKSFVEGQGHKFIRQDHAGVSKARNTGIKASRGEWIAFLDSDDRWLEDKLEKQLKYHQINSDVLISQTEEIWIRNGKRVNKKDYHTMAEGEAFFSSLERCSISPSSVMIKRELFDQCGLFDERMAVCEDYDLWLRISLKHRVGLIKEPLIVKYGGHSDQLSRSVEAIDRFRLFALLKLLNYNQLEHEKLKAALLVLARKSEILRAGAIKRSLDSAGVYESLNSIAEEALKFKDSEGLACFMVKNRDKFYTFESELSKLISSCVFTNAQELITE